MFIAFKKLRVIGAGYLCYFAYDIPLVKDDHMINLTSNEFIKLAVKVLVIAYLFGFSETYSADDGLLVGGARADTNVSLRWLSENPPEKSDIVETYNKRRNLPKDWAQLSNNDKGMRAEHIARVFFSSVEHTNGWGSKFTTIACDGSYSTVNGYDGLYVVVDSDGAVARFNGDNVVKSTSFGDPIVIINESKFSSMGKLIFNAGIALEDGGYAVQMSEAWVRIVAHNVLKRVEERQCTISTDAEVCTKVYSVLQNVVRGNVGDLRNVFRTATVLDNDGKLSVCALGKDVRGLNRTKELLRQLLGLNTL